MSEHGPLENRPEEHQLFACEHVGDAHGVDFRHLDPDTVEIEIHEHRVTDLGG